MKHITRKQSRIIAKAINKFFKTNFPFWDVVDMTIKETSEAVYNNTELVYWHLYGIQDKFLSAEYNEIYKECEKILDMIRYPEYVAGPLAEAMKEIK